MISHDGMFTSKHGRKPSRKTDVTLLETVTVSLCMCLLVPRDLLPNPELSRALEYCKKTS